MTDIFPKKIIVASGALCGANDMLLECYMWVVKFGLQIKLREG